MTSCARTLVLSVLVALCTLRPPAASAAPVTFDRGQVTVVGAGGAHRLSVEVAVTPEQRARGLMFRDSLAPGSGMLFLFGEERVVTLWMKDTRLALDLLFLGPEGRILKVVEAAEPFSLELVSSEVPVWGVLEVAAGVSRALGLRPGDRVVHPGLAGRR